MLKKLLWRFYPASIIKTLANYRILSSEYGQFSTMKKGCVDKRGEEIPWYTYPAIEYIRQLDFSDKTIFEFGSGNSSIFWARRCKQLVVVEDNQEWYNKVAAKLPPGTEYKLVEARQDYVASIAGYKEFDIIIIDGNHRMECAVEALKKLNSGGFIILDNADWHEKTAKLLRDADLIEVDMSGFGPINGYPWTTSFFFSRDVKLKPLGGRQPAHVTGGWALNEK